MLFSVSGCEFMHPTSVPLAGLEHTANSRGKPRVDRESGAESGAVSNKAEALDADLRELVRAWPSLPAAMRAGILAMIRVHGQSEWFHGHGTPERELGGVKRGIITEEHISSSSRPSFTLTKPRNFQGDAGSESVYFREIPPQPTFKE